MLNQLKLLLDNLEQKIDNEKVVKTERLHQKALTWKTVERLPVIASYPFPKDEKHQPFPHGQVFDDPEKMLYNQLLYAFDSSIYLSQKIGDDLPITIRPDFGVVLIPSVFGAEVEQTGDNPPWIRHNQQHAPYQQIIDGIEIDFSKGLLGRIVETYKYYKDVLNDYPRLKRVTNVVLPDMQGPFDNIELLVGSNVLLDLYTQKDMFIAAMEVVTDAQISIARYLDQFTTNRINGFTFQHGFMLKGGMLIRNDSSIMISPQMYAELIAPFDDKVLKEFGGGIHSCGKIEHLFKKYLSLDYIQCIDFGQSELNDLDILYEIAIEKQIPLIRVAVSLEELVTSQIFKKYPTGVSLIIRAESFEQAVHALEIVRGQSDHFG